MGQTTKSNISLVGVVILLCAILIGTGLLLGTGNVLAVDLVAMEAEPGTAASLGMYLPLLAADPIVLARIQPDSPFVSPSDALPSAVGLWWMFAVMALPIGIIREILGKGTLFGLPLFFNPDVGGMSLPFAGLIMLGFGMALYNRNADEV